MATTPKKNVAWRWIILNNPPNAGIPQSYQLLAVWARDLNSDASVGINEVVLWYSKMIF